MIDLITKHSKNIANVNQDLQTPADLANMEGDCFPKMRP
jgi:hypothetical protein